MPVSVDAMEETAAAKIAALCSQILHQNWREGDEDGRHFGFTAPVEYSGREPNFLVPWRPPVKFNRAACSDPDRAGAKARAFTHFDDIIR